MITDVSSMTACILEKCLSIEMAERASMEEKERMRQGKKRSEKKKKKFQCGNRTCDLLICVAIVLPRMRINDQTSRYVYISQISIVMT